jgi:hypothetical protein
MIGKTDPWYIHAGLYAVIIVLIYILINVAIIEPREVVEHERYLKNEARLRMKNLKEIQLLYFKKNKQFTDNLDALVEFYKNDPIIDSARTAFDSLTNKPANPFIELTDGKIEAESLYFTPKSRNRFVLMIDSTKSLDTVITTRGRFVRVDTTIRKGTRYKIEDPDGYGYIGDLENEALKNVISWE